RRRHAALACTRGRRATTGDRRRRSGQRLAECRNPPTPPRSLHLRILHRDELSVPLVTGFRFALTFHDSVENYLEKFAFAGSWIRWPLRSGYLTMPANQRREPKNF